MPNKKRNLHAVSADVNTFKKINRIAKAWGIQKKVQVAMGIDLLEKQLTKCGTPPLAAPKASP